MRIRVEKKDLRRVRVKKGSDAQKEINSVL